LQVKADVEVVAAKAQQNDSNELPTDLASLTTASRRPKPSSAMTPLIPD